jgi:RNase P/RNase MRP subunit p30
VHELNSYVDLSVKPYDCMALKSICKKAKSLGYRVIGVDASLLKKCNIECGDLSILPRTVLEDTSIKDLRRKSRGLDSLVVVNVNKLTSLRHIPSIKTIDIIRINAEMAKHIDRSQAKLLSRNIKLLELSLPLFTSSKNNLYRFAIAVRRMHAYDIPYALVSDARNTYELWHPKMVKGLLELLGIPEPYSLMPLTSFPFRALSKFVLKL